MKKTITQMSVAALLFGALSITGCGSGGATVVETPELTAEDQAKIEAQQADYAKSMQESYGKGR